MFKHSFFYRYLSPYAGRLLLNAGLRVLSAFFTMVLLLGMTPVLSLLFGRMGAGADTTGRVPTTAGGVADAAASGSGAMDAVSSVIPQNALSETLIQSACRQVQDLVVAHGHSTALAVVCAVLILLYFLKNLCAYMGLYLFTPIRNHAVAQIRCDLFSRLMILPLSFFSSQRKGDLLSRLSSDIQEIDEAVLKQVQAVLTDLFMIIFLVSALFMLSTPLTLVVMVLLPVTGFLTGYFAKTLRRASPKLQAGLGNLVIQTEESIEGVKTLRSYNTTAFSIAKFKADNERYYNLKVPLLRRHELGSPLNEVVGTLAIVIILVVGGYYILEQKGSLSPEAFITYLLTMIMILQPAKNLTAAYYAIERGRGAVRRIKEILYADEVIKEAASPISIASFEDCIEFKNVSFAYDSGSVSDEGAPADVSGDAGRGGASAGMSDEGGRSGAERGYVLSHIDLKIEKGKFVAIVGPSGSGKSTLVNMIPRFYDAVEGEVLIDGRNIKDYKIDDLRRLSALVSQDTVLFNDTIGHNIALGRVGGLGNDNSVGTRPVASENAVASGGAAAGSASGAASAVSMNDIRRVADAANATEFIEACENGFDTLIGDGGCKLSGGQRQRLGIARALLKDAPILILDEAGSALDTHSERLIQQALERDRGVASACGSAPGAPRTIISVAHRLSSVRHADEIIVIDKGRIVERGTHEALLCAGGLYAKLCQMQQVE